MGGPLGGRNQLKAIQCAGTKLLEAHFSQLRVLPSTHRISSSTGQSTMLAVRGLAVWLSISHETRLRKVRWRCLSRGCLQLVPLPPYCNLNRREQSGQGTGQGRNFRKVPLFTPGSPMYRKPLSLQRPSQVSGLAREGWSSPLTPAPQGVRGRYLLYMPEQWEPLTETWDPSSQAVLCQAAGQKDTCKRNP